MKVVPNKLKRKYSSITDFVAAKRNFVQVFLELLIGHVDEGGWHQTNFYEIQKCGWQIQTFWAFGTSFGVPNLEIRHMEEYLP